MIKMNVLIFISYFIFSSIVFANGSATVKLSPKMKVISSNKETILKEKLKYWKNLFVDIQILNDNEKIADTPRVVADKDGKVMSINNDSVYINKLSNINFYKPMAVYRIGIPVKGNDKKVLGFIFNYLSNASLVKHNVDNNLSLVQLSKVNKEVIAGDRVLNKYRDTKLKFNKIRKNKNKLKGHIVSIIEGVKYADVGKNIVLDLGKNDKIKAGDLLQIEKKLNIKRSIQLYEDEHFTADHFLNEKRDKNTAKYVELPKETVATLLVYRVFENTSLALVIDGKEPAQLKQAVVGFNK